MKTDYLIISPCRNEARYMKNTLGSVLAQSLQPKLWVIVDDGSTDDTSKILQEYAARHDHIKIITRPNRGRRSVGPGVIEAFYAGYEAIHIEDYNFICKLDLDLILPETYFETLVTRMNQNPRLGTCSGKPYYREKNTGRMISEKCGDENSIGASKFYRRECFQQIGGFVREVMWDGIDGHLCRMNGWTACSWDEPALRFTHLRPMGSSQKNIITGRMRHGYGQYFMGTNFFYMTLSALYRMTRPPVLIGGFSMWLGYVKSMLAKNKRFDYPGFQKFLFKYHWSCLVIGKKRAVQKINSQTEAVWRKRWGAPRWPNCP